MWKLFKKTDISHFFDREFAEQAENSFIKAGNISTTVIAIVVVIYYLLTSVINKSWIKTAFDLKMYKVTVAEMIIISVLALISILHKHRLKSFRYIWLAGLVGSLLILCIPYFEAPELLIVVIMGSVLYFDPDYTFYSALSCFLYVICRVIYESRSRSIGFMTSLWAESHMMLLVIISGLLCTVICYQAKCLIISYRMAEDDRSNKERELSIAGKIQEGFLSKQFPSNENYEISAMMTPAKEVGGDFYDFFPVGHSHIGLIIADVSDKGMPASLMMTISKIILKDYIINGLNFEHAVEKANKAIINNNSTRQFITAFLCIINLETGKMSYVNAGHNPPCLIHADGACTFITSASDFVLGVRKKAKYHSYNIALEPGDKLFLYTDGIPEKQNTKEEYFGKERIAETLSANASMSAEKIIISVKEAVDGFGGGVLYADDMTSMVFSLKKLRTPAKPYEIISEDGDIAGCEAFIKQTLRSAGLKEETVIPIVTAADEILSNIYKYAYKDGESKYMKVAIQIFDDTVEVTFADRGIFFNPLEKVRIESDHENIRKRIIVGLGIPLVWKLMDDMVYSRTNDENLLTIVKQI